MIADLVKKNELLEHVKAWKALVVRARTGLKKADPTVLAIAKQYNWKDEELAALEEFLMKAEAGFDHKDDVVYIAPEEELSILQTIMENAYTEAGMVEIDASGGQGLIGGAPPITNK